MKNIVDAPISVKVSIAVILAFLANLLSDLNMILGAGVVTFAVLVASARIAAWLAFNDC